jgi:hypothetical protein
MGDEEGAHRSARIERVRCLSCGVGYVKPAGRGTVSTNPGCPVCGYVGWVLESSPVRRHIAPLRSGADRRRPRPA